MRRSGLTVLALLLAVALGACSSSSSRAAAGKANGNRRAAPNFSLKDADGKTVQLADFKGKVVLLNFWATWCGPCKYEIPWFIEFERKFKHEGLVIVGVSMDDDGWDVVKPFASHSGINYRVVLGNDTIAQDYGGVDSLPTTFMIDRAGNIATTHVGLASKSTYENDIRELLDTSARDSSRRPAGLPAFLIGPER